MVYRLVYNKCREYHIKVCFTYENVLYKLIFGVSRTEFVKIKISVVHISTLTFMQHMVYIGKGLIWSLSLLPLKEEYAAKNIKKVEWKKW